MSFERPFSSPPGWSFRKITLVGLILLHSAWIIIHLNLVSQGVINPWKLGGYGMYTIPASRPLLYVYDMNFSPYLVPGTEVKQYKFQKMSHLLVFRCDPFPEAALTVLFQENPDLINRKLRLVATEQKFFRNPIRVERLPHAILDIRWPEPEVFEYAGEYCDKKHRGRVEFKQ